MNLGNAYWDGVDEFVSSNAGRTETILVRPLFSDILAIMMKMNNIRLVEVEDSSSLQNTTECMSGLLHAVVIRLL